MAYDNGKLFIVGPAAWALQTLSNVPNKTPNIISWWRNVEDLQRVQNTEQDARIFL